MQANVFTIKLVAALVVFGLSVGFSARADEEQMAPPETSTTSAPSAAAGGKAPAVKGRKKETKINFDDEAIEGELKKPELFYMFQKKQFNFKRLIKLREDFLPEMRRDADEVRRSRSK